VQNSLIIGYGNPDRQDDGVSWHVLLQVAKKLGIQTPPSLEDSFPVLPDKPEFLFVLQLVPEMGEMISKFERVCFVDAHTGEIKDEVRAMEITPEYQHSAFTHHMTPQTCLEIARTVYGAKVEGLLVSVRGYHFEFGDKLSAKTEKLVPLAVEKIVQWLNLS
jgi:hydrogenase maturation protease